MKIKSLLARPFANYIYKGVKKGIGTAVQDQEAILKDLLKVGKITEFGNEHRFKEISTYDEFSQAVPIRDYENLKGYINRIKEGKHNVLWKGRPIYFAKTSGTTSGVKYIPISKESISNHINPSEAGNVSMEATFLPILSISFPLYGSKFTPPCTITDKFGNRSPIFFPVCPVKRSKYICIHGGIPLINVMSWLIVSETILSSLVSQSSMQFVSYEGNWLRRR